MKQFIKNTIKKLFLNPVGRKVFAWIAPQFKYECMEALGREHNLAVRFSNIKVPEKIKGFEDLCFLFWSSPLNRGILRMDLDEASYLFKLVRSLSAPTCVEIGRFKGGSSFLIASAMQRGRLISLDLHVKMMLKEVEKSYDEEFEEILKKIGMREKVEIIVADSTSYDNSKISCDLLFIDGDHSYEGVKKDYEHWISSVKPGGHVLFHDAADARVDSTGHDDIRRLMRELEDTDCVHKVAQIASLVHFVRK